MLKPIVRSDLEDARARLQELGRRAGCRLTVIASDGKVLADSHAHPGDMENHNDRLEVQEARRQGRGVNTRYSGTIRTEMMYVALPLESERRDGVIVRSAFPLTQIQDELNSLYLGILLAFAITAAAGAGVTYALVRKLTLPLRRIEQVALAVASGDFSQKAPTHPPVETAAVGKAINRMSEEIAAMLHSLKAESSKLEAVISGMEEGVIAIDSRGEVLHSNGSARNLLGLASDPRGLKVWEAVRLQGFEEMVQNVLRGGGPIRKSVEVAARRIALCICPAAAASGAVIVSHDATEEHRYDSLRKEFVANVSHELRTPLSLIQGYVETLREGAIHDEARAAEFLEIIDKNVRRLSAIVADLLELSKLESSGQVAKRQTVRILTLFERVRESFLPLAARKAQILTFDSSDAVIEADPDLLERALSNLVDNALKYTPVGGKVGVSAESEAGTFRLVVRDTGVGIPEKDLARVFERFYRVDKSRSRELGGTGLGLAIVKHIAQLHGGSVNVESEVGAGSTFVLRIPATPP
ncbi:MAG TPA: ATP-binding protein [Planctomycetota bacterium]|nr:ATP-binding protein [Planctomycetota bacterium]